MKKTGIHYATFWVLFLFVFMSVQTVSAASMKPYYGKNRFGSNYSAYREIIRNVKAGKGVKKGDEFRIKGTIKNDKIMENYIQDDYPRLFWVGQVYDGRVNGKIRYHVMIEWEGAYKQRAAFENKVKKAVSKVKKSCKGKSRAQQAKIALEYIVNNCTYGYGSYDQTAYGVFVKKKALCSGYARAYKLLLDELGIPCLCVPCRDNDGISHKVNYVKIGKKWYMVDPTDADCDDGITLDVFLIGKSDSRVKVAIRKAHGVKLPELSTDNYNISRDAKYHILPYKLVDL